MSGKTERLAEQREFLEDMEHATSERLNAEARRPPPRTSPGCLPGRSHYWFRSRRDGQLHCSICYAVKP